MDSSLLQLIVQKKTQEALDIASFDLVDPSGGALPPFSAGAHLDVHGPTGLVRQYSLCNSPADGARYQIGVLRDPKSRGGSVAMHDLVTEGSVLSVSMPKNHFPLATSAQRSLLLAGGIGVTPILSMAESLAASGARFEMHYFSRSLERTAFHQRILKSDFSDKAFFHLDDEAADKKVSALQVLQQAQPQTHLYVCGPSGFLEHVLDSARDLGWSETFIHFEYFGTQISAAEGDTDFKVKIASTGGIYTVAADKSVTIALAEQGIDIPVSCEQGVCGTCVTRILEGTPDHRDHYLTDTEHKRNDQFTPCCSRAKSPMLVLDL